jgi:hypothetical protein
MGFEFSKIVVGVSERFSFLAKKNIRLLSRGFSGNLVISLLAM